VVKAGSLFSGIGGLDLGLERAGMQVVWQVEKDPYCQKILAKHWPEVPCYGDIKEIDFTALPPVDLICGGFPCQPWSVAGAQKGVEDERNLWPDTIRAVREVMPRWCVFENVPGLLTHRYFGRIIGDLAKSGYIVEWNCIPAALFGLPHIRTRLVLVAYSASLGWNFLNDKPSIETQKERLSYHQQSGYRWKCENGRHSVEFVGWSIEPRICGSNAGVSSQMDRDRIHALGNAVVPQVAEWIGRRILKVDEQKEIAV